jgi:hypothetical protein
MKRFYILSALVFLGLMLVAWAQAGSSLSGATVLAIEATSERPYRSYPPPTGFPAFRRYYQKRCYPGCHAYPTPTPEPALSSASTRERPYRSYPPPTGFPAFRRYYQKRCYPGCHTYGTPTPDRVHP